VIDATRPPDREIAEFQGRLRDRLQGRRLILALHKADQPAAAAWETEPELIAGHEQSTPPPTVRTSAADGAGLAALRRVLLAEIARFLPFGTSGTTEAWEAETWRRAAAECRAAADEWETGLGELSAERLRRARGWLSGGRDMGDADTETLLARIFGSLCVGK